MIGNPLQWAAWAKLLTASCCCVLGGARNRIYTFTLSMVLSLFLALPCFAAITYNTNAVGMSYAANFTDASNITSGFMTASAGSNYFFTMDFGVTTVFQSLLLFTSNVSSQNVPTYDIYYTVSPVLTSSDAFSASWVFLKSVTNSPSSITTPLMLGFDQPVTARAVKFLFPQPNLLSINTGFGSILFQTMTQETVIPPTADTYAKIDQIQGDTAWLVSTFSNYSSDMRILKSGKTGGDSMDLNAAIILGAICALILAVTWKG